MRSAVLKRPWGSIVVTICILLPGQLALATPLSAQGQPGYSGSPSVSAARELYERARYDEARAMLDALLEAGTVDAEILWYRGLLEPDNTRALDRYFSRIINHYPRSNFADRARFKIGQWRYDSGFYLTARDLFSDVAWRQGDSPLGQEARYWRGMTWVYSLEESEAQPDSVRSGLRLIKRVARNATEPELRGMAHISVAEISLSLGEPDSALVYAQEILEAPYLEDHHPRALYLQARAWDDLDDRAQARTLFQIVFNRHPGTWEGREARRWIFEDQERTVQARIDTMRSTGAAVTAPGDMGEGDWTVQVGSFRQLKNATDLVLNLTADDYPAWHQSERVRGTLYIRVYVGRFETRAEAGAFGRRLQSESAWVVDHTLVDLSRR